MPDSDSARVLFISHTAIDHPYAVALSSVLETLAGPRAIDVRFSSSAESGPQGGQVWRDWIDARITDYWSALIVVTPESMGKPWLLWEAGACHAAKLLGRDGEQTSMTSRMSFFMVGSLPPRWRRAPRGRSRLAEVDGNRTRRTGVARPTRFEGGGAHQVPGHLRLRP